MKKCYNLAMERFLKSRYKIGEKISESPFSVGYKGFFLGTDKPVIIKIYKRGTLNSNLINRMKKKVKEFSKIKHHGVAQMIDGDYGWQGFYYVREYIRGKSLKDILEEKQKIGIEKAVAIAEEVSRTLELVHAKGVIHGGLKPGNIFVDEQGIIKLADFVIEGEIKESMPQKVLNLLEDGIYISPEELMGNPASFSSDIYALGMILCEMLSRDPLLDEGLPGGLRKLRSSFPFDKDVFVSLPKYLQDIVIKALRRDPFTRFPSISEFRQSLEMKSLVVKPAANEEFVTIFENTITRYEGDGYAEKDEKSGDSEEKSGWGKETKRNLTIAIILMFSFLAGLVYVFMLGR